MIVARAPWDPHASHRKGVQSEGYPSVPGAPLPTPGGPKGSTEVRGGSPEGHSRLGFRSETQFVSPKVFWVIRFRFLRTVMPEANRP